MIKKQKIYKKLETIYLSGIMAGILLLTGCKDTITLLKEEVEQKFTNKIVSQEKFPIITLTEEELHHKFYYNMIETEEERLVYKELYEGFLSCSDEIYVHGDEEMNVSSLIDYVLDDFPEIFWCDIETEIYYEIIQMFHEEYVILYPEYEYSMEEIQEMKQEVEDETQECIRICQSKESDYEKVKYIYEYIIDTVTYMEESPNNQNMYSALVTKKSVCAGYAKATQYLLEQSGVVCATIGGEAIDENKEMIGHAWNLVQCDGKYYHVDTTWGDMDIEDEKEPYIRIYDYLCCSDADLAGTHQADYEDKMPECSSEDLNYYRMHGMFYDIFDSEQILNAMKNTITAYGEYTTFKFANEKEYVNALEAIESTLLDQALDYQMDYYGTKESNCTYEFDEFLWKINIFWEY